MRRILIITCLVLALASAAGADIINVPGDQPTLAAAVTFSQANDEIVLAAGVFPLASTLYVSHPLTIRGAGMGATVIQCPFGGGSGYGLSVQALSFAFADFSLEGAGAAGPRYGFHVSGPAYADAPSGTIDRVEVSGFYRTGFDFNGIDGVAIGDCFSHHNSGAGLALCDGKNVTFTNITTHDNAWGGVAVYTYGRYHTPGASGISFLGTNSMPDAFYIEEGNYNDPANPIPISFGSGGGDDVTLQLSDFAYFMTGESDNDNEYHYFFADLATAIAVAALDPSPFHMASGAHVVGLADGLFYYGIQGAINAAAPGDVVEVAAGTYVEGLEINKPITLRGQGPTTILQANATTGPAIQLTGSGASALEPILIQDLRIEVDNAYGITVPGTHDVSWVVLDGVDVIGSDDFGDTENEIGLQVNLTASLRHLVVTDCSFQYLHYGWYTQMNPDQSAWGIPSNIEDVQVTDTDFLHNLAKGLYLEKLHQATFTRCVIDDNGRNVGFWNARWNGGLDLNLKGLAYADFAMIDCEITNNGLGCQDGAGLMLKARDDGATYGAYPASLDGVLIEGCTITGNERGVRLGEPGKLNLTPVNAVIRGCTISGNVPTYAGVDGSLPGGLISYGVADIEAGLNWWGDTDPSDQVSIGAGAGAANVSPWLGFPVGTTPMTWYVDTSIQAAIDAADDYDTIHVAAGHYVEALLIEKPLDLYGATAGVNKNGYPVPADYAWDPAVETIITHPNPTSAYDAIVDIHDTSDVTFDGFVVGELNAVANLNTSLVRVYAHTQAIERINVVNCVIGPNTNLAAQDGAQGRMGLYIVNHPYDVNGVMNSTFAHNKIFDCKGNGDNVFLWTSYYAYGAAGPADMTGTVIDDNEISGSHRAGIETAGGFAHLTISNNRIFGNSQLPGDAPDFLKYGHGIQLIRGSSDKVSDPLTAYGPVDLLIIGNEIYGNSKNGVYMGPKQDGVTFTDNVIRDNGWNGVMLDLAGNYWNPQYESPPVSEQYACYDCAEDISGSGNRIYGNGVSANPIADYGVLVSGTPTNGLIVEAEDNWWGSALGPEHPANPFGDGDRVSDHVDYDPWLGQADVTVLPDASGPINCAETVVLTVGFTPDADTPALRGFTITLSASAELSFGAADIEDGDPFAGLGMKYYRTIDNSDGTWTVDSAVLGATAGLTGPADLFTVEMHPAADGPGVVELLNVVLRDLDNGDIIADVGGATISVDCTSPPAVTDITAAPAHESVNVAWAMADETDVVEYVIYRGLWYDTTPGVSAYPEYDDLEFDVIPTRPADRQDAHDSAEWAYAGTVSAGTTEFVDEYVPRGVYWYEVFAVDAATNYGPVAAANDRATNYWLGDMPVYDGDVDNGDITKLGAVYGYDQNHEDYDAEVDVGPTDDRSGVGIPETDSVIGFEDLMVFALNYGNVMPRSPAVGDPLPVLAWTRITADTWAIELVEPCSDLKGLRLTARLPGDGGFTVEPGDLLGSQAGPVFLRNAGDDLDVGLALMGRGAVFVGTGELLRVVFEDEVETLRPSLLARGLDNADLEVSLTTGLSELPTVFSVRQNFPNPFNPQTTIAFDLPEARDVRVRVYALDGSLVRTLVDDRLVQGRHEVVWNGRDDGGRQVATGAYFYRIAAGEDLVVRKMLLMK